MKRGSPANGQCSLRRACIEALEHRRMLNFSPAVDYSMATSPQDVVTADFNKDGNLDLASVNAGSSNVTVRLGNGTGGFGSATQSPTGAGANCVAVGDLNNDMKPDLVTGSQSGVSVSVLLGNGDGSFAAPLTSNFGTDQPLCVALGDINRDGKLDLLVGSHYSDPSGYYADSGAITVMLGTGTGGFGGWVWYNQGADPTDIAMADLNGDGRQDAVVSAEWGITVYIAEDFYFGWGTSYPKFASNASPRAVALGDFTGDGKLDVVAAGSGVDVLRGNGNGTFAAALVQAVGSGPYTALATGDFNGDAKLDVVLTDGLDNGLNLLLNNGSGGLVLSGVYPVGAYPFGVAAGNFNNDGRVDVATANSVSNNLSVLLNDGNWSTLPPALKINNVSVVEGNSGPVNAVLTVTLERGPASANVTVNYSTRDGSATAGSDYVTTSGALTFLPGETSKTITVPVKGDSVPEYDEEFQLKLSGATNAQIFDPTGIGTITDDEPHLNISPSVSVTEGDSGTSPLNFTVTLSSASTQTVTVDYATWEYQATPGSDYDAVAGTLTFLPGQTSNTIAVPIRGDLIDEDVESFYVFLTDATNALVFNIVGTGNIIDNDSPPALAIGDLSRAEGNFGTTAFQFTVSLARPSANTVTVNYATAAGSATNSGGNADYQSKSGQLSFAPGQTSQTVTVSVNGDTRSESDETFFVNLSQPVNAAITDGQGVGTILNDESRGKTWVGAASGGSWSTGSNWSPSGVPNADSLVTIFGAAVTLPANATVSELSLKGNATLTLAPNGNRVFRTAGLFLDAGTTLNLNDNDMILDYAAGTASPLGAWNGSAYDGVTGQITRGYNHGAWDGSGLVTTRPDALNGMTTLAVAEMSNVWGLSGSQTAMWQAHSVDATTIVIKYTYAGDANLDGQIDAGDYGILDAFVQTQGAFGYANGDFNLDGFIDAGDYGLIDYNIQLQGPQL